MKVELSMNSSQDVSTVVVNAHLIRKAAASYLGEEHKLTIT